MYHLDDLVGIWLAMANNHRYRKYTHNGTFCERVVSGVLTEGLDFLTKRLPQEGKLFERQQATGELPEWGGILPSGLVADLQDTNWLAVDCVRQLTQLYYKLEVTHDQGLVDEFLANFKTVDRELASHDWDPSWSHRADMLELISSVLAKANPFEISPRHGRGATSCKTKSFEKYYRVRFFKELDETYPYDSHFYVNLDHLEDESLEWFQEDAFCSAERSHTKVQVREWEVGVPQARVCLVPKDSRGPRVISCEPAEMMFIQQGLMRLLYTHLESHRLTRGSINFRDQTVNRMLAQSGSITGKLATIDMKDASDRVSKRLVQDVFPPDWVRCLMASRTPATLLPSGEVVHMHKFAPMGSSVCFPVEALIFWASAIATQRRLGEKRPFAAVYGDDIIVPTHLAPDVMEDYELLALKVNRHKSFLTGGFRESCGGDYYKGVDVTPVRLKKPFTSSVLGLTRGADFLNNCVRKFGDVECTRRIIDLVQERCRYTFPRTNLEVPCTVRTDVRATNDVRFRRRWNQKLQRFEHLILCPRVASVMMQDPGWVELLRWQLERAESRPDPVSWLGPLNPDRDPHTGELTIEQMLDDRLKPGEYADPRQIQKAWRWAWLG